MSIKMTRRVYPSQVKKELGVLLEWVKKQSSATVYDFQEIILNIIRVINDNSFQATISSLRQTYKIPDDFFTNGRVLAEDDRYEEWLNSQSSKVPVDPWHEQVKILCQQNKLNPDKYGEFILNYLYFNGVIPTGDLVTFENALSIDEPKYKARLIAKYKDKTDLPEGAYIRIYKDTTINQIHEYIDKNQIMISFLQKYIEPFPKTRNRKVELFKRDLTVYLLHSTGFKTDDIGKALVNILIDAKKGDVSTEENEMYSLGDANIRKIVSDMHKQTASSLDT